MIFALQMYLMTRQKEKFLSLQMKLYSSHCATPGKSFETINQEIDMDRTAKSVTNLDIIGALIL